MTPRANLDRRRHLACPHELVAVVAAVVHEVEHARRREHAARGGAGRCDVTLVVGGRQLLHGGRWILDAHRPSSDPAAPCGCEAGGSVEAVPVANWFSLHGECGCGDLVVGTVTSALLYLEHARAPLANPPAAARRHIRMRQHDHLRAQRGERGAQTRVDRLPGGDIGRRLDTDDQRWLLHDVADEAGSSAPLDGHDQLLERLAVRRCRRTGEEVDAVREQVERDYEHVRDVCGQVRRVNVGSREQPEMVTWWDAYVERPLGTRPRPSTVSLDDERVLATGRHEPLATFLDRDDDVVLGLLTDTLEDRAGLTGTDLLDALLQRIRVEGLLTESAARTFRTDPVRVRDAVGAISAISAIPAPTAPRPVVRTVRIPATARERGFVTV